MQCMMQLTATHIASFSFLLLSSSGVCHGGRVAHLASSPRKAFRAFFLVVN